MQRIDKITGLATAVVIATLLFALLLINQPPVSLSHSSDHATTGTFTLESAYTILESDTADSISPDFEHPDFLKPPVNQLADALSRQTRFSLVLAGSNAHTLFATIRAPPYLS